MLQAHIQQSGNSFIITFENGLFHAVIELISRVYFSPLEAG